MKKKRVKGRQIESDRA